MGNLAAETTARCRLAWPDVCRLWLPVWLPNLVSIANVRWLEHADRSPHFPTPGPIPHAWIRPPWHLGDNSGWRSSSRGHGLTHERQHPTARPCHLGGGPHRQCAVELPLMALRSTWPLPARAWSLSMLCPARSGARLVLLPQQLLEELRCRTIVVGIFPTGLPVISIVGGVLME
jgi:hypothetical protein